MGIINKKTEGYVLYGFLVILIIAVSIYMGGLSLPSFNQEYYFEVQDLEPRVEGNYKFAIQSTGSFDGEWNSSNQMLFMSKRVGNGVVLTLRPPKEGFYNLKLKLTSSFDFGKVDVFVDGKLIKNDIDLYSFKVSPMEVSIREVELKAISLVTIRISGRNPKNFSPHYQFGVDGLTLIKK